MVAAHGWLHVAGPAALTGDVQARAAAEAAARAAGPPGNRDVDGLLVGACDLLLALAQDDAEGALAAAERSTAILRGSQTAPPAHFRAAWPLLLAVRRRPEAEAAITEAEAAGVSVHHAGRGCLVMARAVVLGWDDPAAAAALAVQADEDLVWTPLWRCVVRRWAAEAARTGGWSVPREWMVESETWLRDHGFERLAERCRSLHAAPVHPRAWQWERLGVSRREADVLQLVIEGLANREIAEQLHLSVRTVEKHVESLLRKTATRSRTQLARVASTAATT
jgi:DNA-binding CsgD family transcriptional regulator